jgi:hypothetical protein
MTWSNSSADAGLRSRFVEKGASLTYLRGRDIARLTKFASAKGAASYQPGLERSEGPGFEPVNVIRAVGPVHRSAQCCVVH